MGDLGSIPGPGRSPGEGNGNPPQDSCLEKSHGQRSLVGYSPWGHKELNATEHVMKGLKKKSLQKLLGGGRGMSLEAWQRSTCVRVRVTSEFDLYCRGSGLQLSQRKRFPALDHPFCTPSPTAASGKMLAWVVKQ